MSNNSLISWGVPRLAELLPLDEESLKQIVTYTAGLSKDEGAEHLKNLLGDSSAALEFISSFSSRREDRTPQQPSSSTVQGSSAAPKKSKRAKPPLHSAGPPRRPENFGNVAGGYIKADQEEDYMSSGKSRQQDTSTRRAVDTPRQAGGLLSSRNASATSSRNQSPAPHQPGKQPPSAAGTMISDLLPNVKSKASKPSRSGGASSGTVASISSSKGSLTTNNIADLTAAIAALEVSTNPTLGIETRKCTCYASIHPLFAPAPNCLNCGKIICSLEGLQPCSFCGTPLLSNDEIQSMIRELRAERGQEKMRAHNESIHRESGPGPAPEPSTSKLDAARAHRDKLLEFQAQNAKRTRVVDEAADFETPSVASTLWMSPSQRALALKKQQRIMREIEEKARPEWEKKKTLMSLDIKGGRVTRVYQAAPTESTSAPTADEEMEGLSYESSQPSGREAFSNNPLLAAGGLIRPVWKAPNGSKVEGAPKERQQTWRRVQDDNEGDNEQWILDGGVHGYT